MIITSLPVQLIMVEGAYADSYGIGVYNCAYTDNAVDYNNYTIRFYYRDENDTLKVMSSNPEFGVTDSEGEIVYVSVQGKFELKSGRSLNFTANEDFCDFVNDNRIEKVELCFVESDQSNENDYLLYSQTAGEHAAADAAGKKVTYTIVNEQPKRDPDTGEHLYHEVTDPQTGEITREYEYEFRPVTNSDYTLSQFTSTVKEEFEVDVDWCDKGGNRPAQLEFNIERKVQNGEFSQYNAGSPTVTSTTSNTDVYSYKVPKYDAGKHLYTYRANPVTDTHNAYRYESNSDQDAFTYISQSEFSCKLRWVEGTKNLEPDTLEKIRSYIMQNFKLVDETAGMDGQGNMVEADCPFTADQIAYDFTTNTLTINGLDEITRDGRAKVYYLTKKHASDITIEGTNDKWVITADNPGVHSSDTDKVYQNAEIQHLLTGTVDYYADITWKDISNKADRERNTDPGNVVLWRYANNPSDPNMLDKVAQVDSHPLVQTDDQGNVVLDGSGKPTYLTALDIDGLDKYDKNGYEYVYYAKEVLSSSLSNYTASYANSGGNTSYALNNGHMTNRIVGTEIFTVDAKWIAAEDHR